MTKTNQYIVLPGGKECRPVNPYDHDGMEHLFNMFEAENHPSIPITEVMPEGETFEGSEVWQWQDKYTTAWFDELFGSSHYSSVEQGLKTRLAIQPLKAIEPVKNQWGAGMYEVHDGDTDKFIPTYLTKEQVDEYKRINKWFKPSPNVVENKEETVGNKPGVIGTYKGQDFDTVDGAWDWHRRGVPETVYSEDELSYLLGEQIMFKTDFIDAVKQLQSQSIEGIVGFVLEWVSENVQVRTEYSRDSKGVLRPVTYDEVDKAHILNMKSDIIKELTKLNK